MEKHEIIIEKTNDGVRFSWDEDAPILMVDVDVNGCIMVCLKDGTTEPINYKLVGGVEYAKEIFKR